MLDAMLASQQARRKSLLSKWLLQLIEPETLLSKAVTASPDIDDPRRMHLQ
jgi:hypothetical protein